MKKNKKISNLQKLSILILIVFVLLVGVFCQKFKGKKIKRYNVLFIGNSHLIPIPDKLEKYINENIWLVLYYA